MNDGKENIRHVTCKSHTARSEKDLYRACPSKLSKRELEDHYFSLVESNTQLKKTINSQRDQIKVLTTKIQRITVQKSALTHKNRDCCANSNAVINEQRESIADLKKANERLSDRISLLNMRLCSAKQFLKRGPAQSTTRCAKCCLNSNTSIKNASTNALNVKEIEGKLQADSTSCLYFNKERSAAKVTDIFASPPEIKATEPEPCQQNKCRTMVDELKLKIANLEEELSKTHDLYSERMHKLEDEISSLREEKLRVQALQTASDHRLEVGEKETKELLHKLREAEMQCDDLAIQLQIEKSKVCELETQIKAADISIRVAKAVEKHNAAIINNKVIVHNNSEILRNNVVSNKDKPSKSSDDSGYTENNNSHELDEKTDSAKTDQNILDQISSLQAQLDTLKMSIKDSPRMDVESAVTMDLLQTRKSDSNESCGGVGGNSTHSNDIFQTLEATTEQIDRYPSTSRASGVLMSMGDLHRLLKMDSDKALHDINNYDSFKKIQISGSLSVDMPRMPNFGENDKSCKSLLNGDDNKRSLNGCNGIRQSGTFNVESLNDNETIAVHNDIDIKRTDDNNTNKNIVKLNIKKDNTFTDDGFTKNRRSSFKGPNPELSYDRPKTIVSSTINSGDITESSSKNITTRGNDIGKVIRAQCQNVSNPSMEFKTHERNSKKKIHYKNDGSEYTPGVDDRSKHLDIRECDRELNSNLDSNRKEDDKCVGGDTETKEKSNTNDVSVQFFKDSGALYENIGSPAGTGSANSTYIVEPKRNQSKLPKEASLEMENKINCLGICESYSRICTCLQMSQRGLSIVRTCSGTSKFKTPIGTKSKFRQCHCSREMKTSIVGAKTNGLTLPITHMPQPLDTSTPNYRKTYNVEASVEVTRSTSPDNTEHEISSLTDLPNEIDDKNLHDYTSPGEEKGTSTLSDSYAATTTDYGSLSEGEVPNTEAKNISSGELKMRDETLSTASNKMEEALRAISKELSRCRELLQGQKISQVIPNIRPEFKFVRY